MVENNSLQCVNDEDKIKGQGLCMEMVEHNKKEDGIMKNLIFRDE